MRSRGVMEKCTYCVQRINAARIQAKREDRDASATARSIDRLRAGLPDAGDRLRRPQRPDSRVAKLKASPRNYACWPSSTPGRARPTWRGCATRTRHPANPTLGEHGDRAPPRPRASTDGEPVHARSCIDPRHTGDRAGARLRDDHRAVAQIPLSKRTPVGWLVGFLIGFALLSCCCCRSATCCSSGVGIWGNNIPVGWALRHHQLRLVDRYRPRRHADLGDSVPLPPAVAHVDQPLRRGDDALRGDLRRHLPGLPRRPSVVRATGCSRIPNTMGLWPHFRSPLIWDVFAVSTYFTVSVLFWYRRPDPRPRDAARPRQASAVKRSSTASWRSAGAAGTATGTTTRWPT